MQENVRMRFQKVLDWLAFVSRQVVGDHMDFFAAGLMDYDVAEERDELGGSVPLRRFTQHLSGLGVEGGIE